MSARPVPLSLIVLTALLFALVPSITPAYGAADWQQRGSDITGEAAADESG